MKKIDLNKVNNAQDIMRQLFNGKGTFVEIHKLRSVGPTLLNRDGNGNAKTVKFGGEIRTVVSSQCRKAAIRGIELEKKTERTRCVSDYVADKIKEICPEVSDQYLDMAKKITLTLFGGAGEGKDKIKTVVSVSDTEIHRIASKILEYFAVDKEIVVFNKKGEIDTTQKEYTDVATDLARLATNSQLDYEIAMFGRMSTNNVIRSVDSSTFYNFAYTTNVSASDSDYFTAQDTFRKAFENAQLGAGHLDERDMNAGCYYSYAGIALTTYFENVLIAVDYSNKEELKERIKKAVDYLVDIVWASIMIMPTTMQHQMASFPDPQCVYATIKTGAQNMTYDKIFEKPVYADRNYSVGEQSVQRLIKAINYNKFDMYAYDKRYWIGEDAMVPNNTASVDLKGMLDDMKGYFYETFGIEA